MHSHCVEYMHPNSKGYIVDAYIDEEGHRSLFQHKCFSWLLGVEIESSPQMSNVGGEALCSCSSFQEPSFISIHLFVITLVNLAYDSSFDGFKL